MCVAAVVIALSVPLVQRKVKPNHWYGVRIPEAFKSDKRWYEINEYGGRLLIRLGIVIGATACIGVGLPKSLWIPYALSALVGIMGGLGTVLILTVRYAKRTS